MLAAEMGLTNQVKSFLNSKQVWTPGIENDFNHSAIDKTSNLVSEFPTKFQNDLTTINEWLEDFANSREYQTSAVQTKFEERYSYTIKSGDTISQIAQSMGTTTQKLIASNPFLTTENRISSDGKYVLIKAGEKLSISTSEIKTQ